MRVKVELEPAVYAYLASLSAAERQSFVTRLEYVRAQPVARSELHFDRIVSQYALRRFEFGTGAVKIAIFEYKAAEGCIRVLECRLRKPRESTRAQNRGTADPSESR